MLQYLHCLLYGAQREQLFEQQTRLPLCVFVAALAGTTVKLEKSALERERMIIN